jgi:hypothetical protein
MRAPALVLLLAVVTAGCLTGTPDARGGQITACPVDSAPPGVEPVSVSNATVQEAPSVVDAVERAAATNETVTVEFQPGEQAAVKRVARAVPGSGGDELCENNFLRVGDTVVGFYVAFYT